MEPGFSGSGAPERTAHPLDGLGAHIPTKMAPGHGASPIRGIPYYIMPKYSTKMDQQYIDLLNLTPKVSEKDQRYNTPWDRAPSVWERAERIINAVFELKSEGTAAILRELRDRLEADMDRIRVEECACEDTADTLLEERGRIRTDMDRLREKEDACDDTAATLREERDRLEADMDRIRVEECACEDTADTLLEERGRIEADMDRIREKEDACDDTAATLREERDLVETDIARVVGIQDAYEDLD